MRIKEEFRSLNGAQVWERVVHYVIINHEIKSVTGLKMKATFVGSCIFIQGGTPGTKRADKGEYLTAKDFIHAYDAIKDWDNINTGTVKPYIKRQQTPFIALLYCAGILI